MLDGRPETGDRRPETGDGRPESRPGLPRRSGAAAKAGAWQCPTCGRHIPRHVEVCRCGSERKRLEALGYTFETESVAPTKRAPKARAQDPGLAGLLVGYQLDTDLSAGWRMALRVFFAVAVITVGVALVRFTHTDPLPIRDNIQIFNTLDGFTRGAGADAANTIPMFLTSTGKLGVLSAAGTPSDQVRGIQESDLREGFCSQSVVRQVRHEYPGFYDNWPNDKLERMVLEKYPQYTDRVCVLSVRFDATASDVIKYELKPRSLLGHAFLWLRTLLLTTAFAAACLNVYYRLIIGRMLPLLEAEA